MKPTGLLSMTLAAALAVACNAPQSNAPNDRDLQTGEGVGTAGDLNRSESAEEAADFAARAAQGGMAEIELGQLAQQRAQNPDVRAYAEMMVRDHTNAANELKQIASQYNLTPPTALDDDHRELLERLSGLSGAEFDREYIEAMVDGHEDMVDLLEPRARESSTGATGTTGTTSAGDPMAGMRQWAAKTLPTVRQHLDEAHRIQETLERGQTTQRR